MENEYLGSIDKKFFLLREQIEAAAGNQLNAIRNIIPYLQEREQTARHILNPVTTEMQREQLIQILQWQNEAIKKILGL